MSAVIAQLAGVDVNPTIAQALKPMAPPDSEVHRIQPQPVSDPLPPELRRAFDKVFLQDRDSERLRHPFPGELK